MPSSGLDAEGRKSGSEAPGSGEGSSDESSALSEATEAGTHGLLDRIVLSKHYDYFMRHAPTAEIPPSAVNQPRHSVAVGRYA